MRPDCQCGGYMFCRYSWIYKLYGEIQVIKRILNIIGMSIVIPIGIIFVLYMLAWPIYGQMIALSYGEIINKHLKLEGFSEVPIPTLLLIIQIGYTFLVISAIRGAIK